MDPITLRIILHGLIALAPQHGNGDALMTALLVSTKNLPSDEECLETHAPRIEFSTSSAECTAAFPKCGLDKEGRCVCALGRDEVSLSLIRVLHGPMPLNKTPPRPLPFTHDTASDFAYVVNLSEYGNTPARGVLPDPSGATPPTALAARFQFPYDTAATCGLVTRSDDGADYAHALSLRPMGAEEGPDEKRQVMAQRVETTVRIDPGAVVKLVISSFPEEPVSRHEFTLLTEFSEEEIEISNDRQHFMVLDRPCDDGVGRDFALFYSLVEQQFPTWDARPVPHIKYSMAKSIADLFPLTDHRLCRAEVDKAPMSHPICPMASFN